jgi:hypothetical protein
LVETNQKPEKVVDRGQERAAALPLQVFLNLYREGAPEPLPL